ncbi:MAG: HEPN domain-containing protein [Acidobacteriota bacterium]
MANRYRDWFRQAEADLRHARNAMASESYEWSCFAAQQSAEKAVKAVFEKHGKQAWGHTVSLLLGELSRSAGVPPELIEKAKILDKYYIPARYPNGFESGAPVDFFIRTEAEQAIDDAAEIIEFCRDQID